MLAYISDWHIEQSKLGVIQELCLKRALPCRRMHLAISVQLLSENSQINDWIQIERKVSCFGRNEVSKVRYGF